MLQYIEQVDSLLCLLRGLGRLPCCFREHNQVFACDLLENSCLMLVHVHLAQMKALENNNPVTWEAIKAGDSVMAKSDLALSRKSRC